MNKNEASNLFKLLGDENRLKICKMLYKNGEMCACHFAEHLECSQPTISHHMKLLVESGLVDYKEVGKWVHYSMNKEKLSELLSFFESECECKAGGCDCGK